MGVDFKTKQLEFAAYIRDPEQNPAPSDVNKDRMDMYRELFFNNIDSFLSDNFPVLKTILNDWQWLKLTQDFYATHKSQSPYFAEIPEEFLYYLENERHNPDDYPFMLELAHYEWVEMALSIAKADTVATAKGKEKLLNHRIEVSPLAWPLAYQYPVQRISPDYLPEQAPEQPTCLIVYRDQHYDVHFIEITPITYRLLQLIQENEQHLTQDYLSQVATELHHPKPELLISAGLAILEELAEKGIIIMRS
ncbi:MAG: DUF2063 domain-containing protein [Methylococcaceae bacterium]|nr:DUF2063 domain-containing protein [Methylococcaceae bacterium]